VCEATGRLDLLDDPRFAGIAQRAKNQAALAAMLQQVFATRTAREWLADFERRGVPCGPVNSFADILGDPALVDSNLIQSMDVPVAGETRTIAYPVRMNGRRTRATRPPPILGEHTQDVFAEWMSGAPRAGAARER
jgi:crotonobetainyl-CoA:carnitine CoA-transferase CaiB-like acyl-CoA transferase